MFFYEILFIFVYEFNGDYLGDLVDDHYIIRRDIKIEPISRIGRIPRNKPAQPQNTGKTGWILRYFRKTMKKRRKNQT